MKKILLGLMLMFSTSAYAAIEDYNTYTLDTDTGIEWLDLSLTAGRSYSELVADELAVGGKYEGWRLATVEEVRDFVLKNATFLSGSFQTVKITTLEQYDAHIDFTNMWSDTMSGWRGTRGMVGFRAIGLGGTLGTVVEGYVKNGYQTQGGLSDWLDYSDTLQVGDTAGATYAWALVRQSCR